MALPYYDSKSGIPPDSNSDATAQASLMEGWVATRTPELWLAVVLVEIAALAWILYCSLTDAAWLPSAGHVIGGVLPVIVPWAAALGGATHALYSLVFHWSEYRGNTAYASQQGWKWNAYYPTRVILGAVFGTVAALIVVFVTKTVELGDGAISSSGKAVLFVVAFVVGFQQDYFRALIERVAAILFVTPDKDDYRPRDGGGGATLAISGKTSFGNVREDKPKPLEFWIDNLTEREVRNVTVTLGGRDPAAFKVEPTDGELKPIPPSRSRVVAVTLAAIKGKSYTATLEVRRSGKVSTSAVLSGKGIAASTKLPAAAVVSNGGDLSQRDDR